MYPLLIAGVYGIFHDWVLSARSISLIFGTLLLLPTYLLIRRFLDKRTSVATILIVSLIPALVSRSADVVRDPVAWFFVSFGLYFFVLQLDSKRCGCLTLSCLCFLLAAWNRIEIIVFLCASLIYLFFFEREEKLKKILFFIAPLIILVPLLYLALGMIDTSIGEIFRLQAVADKLSRPVLDYRNLRSVLATMIHQPEISHFEFFLEKARDLVWLIALGTLFTYTIKAFFYPFFLVFVLGLPGTKTRMKKDKRLAYLLLICASMFVMLYFHLLQTWIIDTRFLVPILLPGCVFMGFGIEKAFHLMNSRLRIRPEITFSIICLAILAFGLPKNLDPREADKSVIKSIGETIAQEEGNDHIIGVGCSMHILRWISFYANLDYPGSPCPQPYSDFRSIVGNDYKYFLKILKQRDIKYFIWEEKHWPKNIFDFMDTLKPRHFKLINRWSHPDTGQMILFKVNLHD
jgi:4-amino-4-deoxy-L-arabinose transferase-like glycosyltransferase